VRLSSFENGFLHELENRAFAFRAIERLSGRLLADPRRPLWQTYFELEQYNASKYQAAASRLDLTFQPGVWTKFRAWLIGSVPKCLHSVFLRFVYAKTIKYLRFLEDLRKDGPREERAFLEYMVAQEVVQIEMMKRALTGRYWEIPEILEKFIEDDAKVSS